MRSGRRVEQLWPNSTVGQRSAVDAADALAGADGALLRHSRVRAALPRLSHPAYRRCRRAHGCACLPAGSLSIAARDPIGSAFELVEKKGAAPIEAVVLGGGSRNWSFAWRRAARVS